MFSVDFIPNNNDTKILDASHYSVILYKEVRASRDVDDILIQAELRKYNLLTLSLSGSQKLSNIFIFSDSNTFQYFVTW